jgi:fatty acid desaturase
MAPIAPDTALHIRRIRDQLPPAAFRPATPRLWHAAVHAALVGAGYAAIRQWPSAGPIAALVIGHSLACLAFVAHEISHNAVIRQRHLKYGLTLAALTPNLIPPTMWNRLHNDAHHGHANTVNDPDRPFIESERQTATRWYAALFYPAQESWAANGLVLAHFVSYIARNVVSVFYPRAAKPAIVTKKPAYRPFEQRVIAVELLLLAAGQYLVFVLAGRSWWNYLWASPVALCVASAVVMAYVFTNHFLNPISHEHDPLSGTTSVRVPRWIDRVHCHFSYHTEHHLFPSLNSDYYPLVSRALKELAPEDYRQVAFTYAWRQLWQQPRFRRVQARRASSASAPRRT